MQELNYIFIKLNHYFFYLEEFKNLQLFFKDITILKALKYFFLVHFQFLHLLIIQIEIPIIIIIFKHFF